MRSVEANREGGEVEEGRCSLEGFLEEGRLRRSVEDLDGRRVMAGILGSTYVTNNY